MSSYIHATTALVKRRQSGEAHTFAPVAYHPSCPPTDLQSPIGIADEIASKVISSGNQKYCYDKLNKVRPYYPCGGFAFSPMWHGLMHAKEELFNVATNAPRFSDTPRKPSSSSVMAYPQSQRVAPVANTTAERTRR